MVRMSFTDQPTHVWQAPEPAPLELPLPSHEPATASPAPRRG
jgi:hypothetical protein